MTKPMDPKAAPFVGRANDRPVIPRAPGDAFADTDAEEVYTSYSHPHYSTSHRMEQLAFSDENGLDPGGEASIELGVVPTCAVRLRGLPFSVSEEDVRQFLTGYPLDDPDALLIIPFGPTRGDGYARFATPEVAVRAVEELNRRMIGIRYIELYYSTPEVMDGVYQQVLLRTSELSRNRVIRLRGLPFKSVEHDILTFFEGAAEEIVDITFSETADGRQTGDAYVEIISDEGAEKCLQKNRQIIGTRYIEVLDSTALEREIALTTYRSRNKKFPPRLGGRPQTNTFNAWNPGMMNPLLMNPMMPPMMMDPFFFQQQLLSQQQPPQPQVPPRPIISNRFVVRIRGLPFSANESMIAEFFGDCNIPRHGVHMVLNAHDRPTGEAFVELISEDDVVAALNHNGGALGHRYIEVFRSSNSDMNRLGGCAGPEPPQQTNNMAPIDFIPLGNTNDALLIFSTGNMPMINPFMQMPLLPFLPMPVVGIQQAAPGIGRIGPNPFGLTLPKVHVTPNMEVMNQLASKGYSQSAYASTLPTEEGEEVTTANEDDNAAYAGESAEATAANDVAPST